VLCEHLARRLLVDGSKLSFAPGVSVWSGGFALALGRVDVLLIVPVVTFVARSAGTHHCGVFCLREARIRCRYLQVHRIKEGGASSLWGFVPGVAVRVSNVLTALSAAGWRVRDCVRRTTNGQADPSHCVQSSESH
jgi:hypothetical protein